MKNEVITNAGFWRYLSRSARMNDGWSPAARLLMRFVECKAERHPEYAFTCAIKKAFAHDESSRTNHLEMLGDMLERYRTHKLKKLPRGHSGFVPVIRKAPGEATMPDYFVCGVMREPMDGSKNYEAHQ